MVFGLCGGGRAVFHDVEFPCAGVSLVKVLESYYAFVWLRLLVGFRWCCAVSYLDGLSICAQFVV